MRCIKIATTLLARQEPLKLLYCTALEITTNVVCGVVAATTRKATSIPLYQGEETFRETD